MGNYATHQDNKPPSESLGELDERRLKLALCSLDSIARKLYSERETSSQSVKSERNLSQMATTNIEDYVVMAKQAGLVHSSPFKCSATESDKLNYKNLFPKIEPETDFDLTQCLQSTRVAGNPTVSADTIRINLPEVFDNQDEISILRLLIKLLANKVNKLSEEKRTLLQHIGTLNEINTEMAAIIENNFKK